MTATQKQELITLLTYNSRTKEEISLLFNINERSVREWIAELTKDYPIICLSQSKGYRIARSEEDIAEAIHQVKENQSRADKINARNKGLMKFLDKAAKLQQCSQSELERRYSNG